MVGDSPKSVIRVFFFLAGGLTQKTWVLYTIKDCYFVNYRKIKKKIQVLPN